MALNRLVRVGVRPHGYGLADIIWPRQLGLEQFRGVGLVEKARLEVEAGRQPEVRVARTGKAVMAHYAVGDVVARTGRDVVEPHGLQRLDADHVQARVALDGLALDVELARNGRADGMEEAQLLAQSARQSHDVNRFPVFVMDVFDNEPGVKGSQARADPTDNLRVGVGNTKDGLTKAAFGVEYPGEEAARPLLAR